MRPRDTSKSRKFRILCGSYYHPLPPPEGFAHKALPAHKTTARISDTDSAREPPPDPHLNCVKLCHVMSRYVKLVHDMSSCVMALTDALWRTVAERGEVSRDSTSTPSSNKSLPFNTLNRILINTL